MDSAEVEYIVYRSRCDNRDQLSPDYARLLPILRNRLKDMEFSRIRHFPAFVATNDLMH
jgi:hypothetical protein